MFFPSTCGSICAVDIILDAFIFKFFFPIFVCSLLKADVLSEEAILKWYNDAHVAKGKSVFLEQMKKFVEWLKNAEEGKRAAFCLKQNGVFGSAVYAKAQIYPAWFQVLSFEFKEFQYCAFMNRHCAD